MLIIIYHTISHFHQGKVGDGIALDLTVTAGQTHTWRPRFGLSLRGGGAATVSDIV